jgi:biopolymer transport protein ExbD
MKIFLVIALISFLSLKSYSQVINNSHDSGSTVRKKVVVVILDHQGNYFIDSKKVDSTKFDSSLVAALKKLQAPTRLDSSIVVINANGSVKFEKVYHVMQVAKRSRAKVVVNMKMD